MYNNDAYSSDVDYLDSLIDPEEEFERECEMADFEYEDAKYR